jgi:hypothetical protein
MPVNGRLIPRHPVVLHPNHWFVTQPILLSHLQVLSPLQYFFFFFFFQKREGPEAVPLVTQKGSGTSIPHLPCLAE